MRFEVWRVACDAVTSFTGVAAVIMVQGRVVAADSAVMAACLIATRKASLGTSTTERISFFAAAQRSPRITRNY